MGKTAVLLAGLILTAVAAGCGGQETAEKNGTCGHKHGHAKKTERCNEACTVCLKCGEIKGTDKCCNLEGREKCPECGLLKRSVGCCVLPAGATEANVCCKCGEIRGSEKCCKTDGRKTCAECGLLEGSPGCCKLEKGKCCGSAECAGKKEAHGCTDHGTHKGRSH